MRHNGSELRVRCCKTGKMDENILCCNARFWSTLPWLSRPSIDLITCFALGVQVETFLFELFVQMGSLGEALSNSILALILQLSFWQTNLNCLREAASTVFQSLMFSHGFLAIISIYMLSTSDFVIDPILLCLGKAFNAHWETFIASVVL